jgi:hypothetical protein
MSHQFLDGFQIRSVLDHMYGERSSQRLWRQAVFQSSLLGIFLQDLPDTLTGQAGSIGVQE